MIQQKVAVNGHDWAPGKILAGISRQDILSTNPFIYDLHIHQWVTIHYNYKLVAIKNHEEPCNNPLGHQHLSNWCPLPRSPYFLKSSTVTETYSKFETLHSTWGNSSSKSRLWTEILQKNQTLNFDWNIYTYICDIYIYMYIYIL